MGGMRWKPAGNWSPFRSYRSRPGDSGGWSGHYKLKTTTATHPLCLVGKVLCHPGLGLSLLNVDFVGGELEAQFIQPLL